MEWYRYLNRKQKRRFITITVLNLIAVIWCIVWIVQLNTLGILITIPLTTYPTLLNSAKELGRQRRKTYKTIKEFESVLKNEQRTDKIYTLHMTVGTEKKYQEWIDNL